MAAGGIAPPTRAADLPLPASLVQQILTRLESDQLALRQFSYREASRVERRGGKGDVRSSATVFSEVFYEDGLRMRRALPTETGEATVPLPPALDREPSIDIVRLTSCFLLDPIGTEMLGDRSTIRIRYAAREGCMVGGGRTARILGNLAGEIWVDAVGYELLRLRGDLKKPVSFGFGMLGKLSRFEIAIDRNAVSPGVFALTRLDYHARGRVFPARTFDLHRTRNRTDFRRDQEESLSSATSTPSPPPASNPDPRPRDRT